VGLWHNANCDSGGGKICQFNPAGDLVAIVASWAKTPDATWAITSTTNPAAGATQTFTNGDTCWIWGMQRVRTAKINFICAPVVNNTFTISEDPNTCVFTIAVASPYACAQGNQPNGGGGSSDEDALSGGGIFLIILTVVGVVYVVGGCIYKKASHGTSGMESCPNVEFWKDLPYLVKDGFTYTFSGCKKGSDSHYDEL